jgi:hypothetical protein
MNERQLVTERLSVPTGPGRREEATFYRLHDCLFSGKHQYLWVRTQDVLFFPRPFTADEANRFPDPREPPAIKPEAPNPPKRSFCAKPSRIWEKESQPDPNLRKGSSAKLRVGVLKGLWVQVTKIEDEHVTGQLLPCEVYGHITYFQTLDPDETLVVETPPPAAWKFPPGSLIETVFEEGAVVLMVNDSVCEVYTVENERKQIDAADIARSLKNDNCCYDKHGWRVTVGDQVCFEDESLATVLCTYRSHLILAIQTDDGQRLLAIPSDEVILAFPPPRDPKLLAAKSGPVPPHPSPSPITSQRPFPPPLSPPMRPPPPAAPVPRAEPSQAAPWWILGLVMVAVDGVSGEFVISEVNLPDVPIQRVDGDALGKSQFVHWTTLRRVSPAPGDEVFVSTGRKTPYKGTVESIDDTGRVSVVLERGRGSMSVDQENVARRFDWRWAEE